MEHKISVDPNIHFGKPCISGTRVPVLSVLELLKEGISFDHIIRDYYSDLEVDDIRACVQYAIEVLAVEDIRISSQA